jgi:hypothetical protein
MLGVDDRDRRADVEAVGERMHDRRRQVFLQHEPMPEHVDQTRDPREPGHTRARHERDVRFTVCRHQVMRADEHQRDARRDDRTVFRNRKTPTERLSGILVIAGEQHTGERAARRLRCNCERGIRRIDSEREQEIADRALRLREIRRTLARHRANHTRSGALGQVRGRRTHGRCARSEPDAVWSVDTLRCLP